MDQDTYDDQGSTTDELAFEKVELLDIQASRIQFFLELLNQKYERIHIDPQLASLNIDEQAAEAKSGQAMQEEPAQNSLAYELANKLRKVPLPIQGMKTNNFPKHFFVLFLNYLKKNMPKSKHLNDIRPEMKVSVKAAKVQDLRAISQDEQKSVLLKRALSEMHVEEGRMKSDFSRLHHMIGALKVLLRNQCNALLNAIQL